MTAVGQELRFEVLGPLVVRRAGAVLDTGRRKQRLLLIRLLLADGRAVAPETLCDELWSPRSGPTPDGAMASLHAHVSKVRAVLEPSRPRGQRTFEVLVTEPAGYALRVPPENRDTVRFEQAVADAHRLLSQGRHECVLRETRRALDMWRGAAFADAADLLIAAHESARLEDLRHAAQELHATALLLSGQIPEALAAAQELTARHPLRETGWALLLRGLYLSGRHPEALQRYEEVRRRFADDLGLDPGPGLRALHDGILRHDLPPLSLPDSPGPTRPTPVPAPATGNPGGPLPGPGALGGQVGPAPAGDASGAAIRDAACTGPSGSVDPSDSVGDMDGGDDGSELLRVTRPAQLPGDLPVFAGRTTESAWLSAASGAFERPGPGASGAVPVIVVGGAPGIGKTTFTVHHAHRIAPFFPDGQLFVNLRGFHPHAPAADPGDVLHSFLTALGVPAKRVPEDIAARGALFRSLLTDRRVLLVLDNARDEQQVRPLLPAGSSCLTLVTSRNQLPGLIAADGARPLTLALPSRTEAYETLARRLGAERLAAEPTAVADIIRLCGRLPLALAVVAARAELEPAFPLQAVADDLRDSRSGLEAFTGSDDTTDVRAVFSWSYRLLDEDAARLFRLLALHPGPDITVPAAASLAGLPLPRTRQLLAGLTRACLVEQPLPGRFALHDLLRTYATELADAHDTAEERHSGTLRVLDHYMFTACAANRLFKQDVHELDLGVPVAGCVPEDVTGTDRASRWFGAEHRVLSGLLRTAVDLGLDRRITGLAWSLKEYLNRQEHWPEAITALTPALVAARRRGDRLEEGRCHRHLGGIYGYLGHQKEAREHLERATAIFEELDVVAEQARAHYATACAVFMFGRVEEAVAASERGLALSRATGDELWLGECLIELAWLYANLGDLETSLRYSEEAIALLEPLDALWLQAHGWDILGHTLRVLDRYEEAVANYRRAMDAFEELGDRRNAVGSLMRRGDARLAMGEGEAARADWVRALDSAEEQSLPHTAREARDRLAALDAGGGPAAVVPGWAVGVAGPAAYKKLNFRDPRVG